MTHLTDAEFVDLLDGRLPSDRARHAEACAACREQADAARAVLRKAGGDVVPEPSPLFWTHFSSNVSEALRAVPPTSRWTRSFLVKHWRLATATLALLVVTGLGWQMFLARHRSPDPAKPAVEETLSESHLPPEDGFVDAWDAIESMAGDLEWEDAQSIGIASRPGSAEPFVIDLTPEERSELARIIEEEIKRSGSPPS